MNYSPLRSYGYSALHRQIEDVSVTRGITGEPNVPRSGSNGVPTERVKEVSKRVTPEDIGRTDFNITGRLGWSTK